MTIEIKKTETETIIEIVGRLDTITAPALDKTINEDIGDTKNLVLDIKGTEYISSAGLRVLLAAQKKMQKIGSMKVIGVCEEVMEVFVNVAHYAYPDSSGDMTLHIGFDEASHTITFRMTDEGVPFDPLKKPDPDITLSAEEREIGGLGIFIAKKTMDSLSYAYENGKNILTMTKEI